jgi:hypothetical protein
MTSKEFVIWLKGFTEGVHEYNITPKQWDLLKERLEEVNDDVSLSPFPFGTPNTTPIVPLPHYPNPLDNPFRVTCSSGSFGTTSTPGFAITTTPGVSSITYTPSGITYGYPSGSVWSYTNSTTGIENDSKEK